MIGAVVGHRLAADDAEGVIERMAAPSTRIVSLTVTEGGYDIDDATGAFDADNRHHARPSIRRDAVEHVRPHHRGAAAPARARLAPFTVMSCDNLEGNGRLARTAFAEFARRRDPALGDWVEHEVRFPSSMVDRITPATTDADVAEVRERFGIEDAWPVVCEPYTQWVLEDSFSAGRPPYEDAGVQMVDDVEPYELMKLRLLNASHQAIAYFGYLCGYRFVHEAAQDPALPRPAGRLHGRGGDPDARSGARRRPPRLQADADRALLQPGGARHDRPPLRGELRSHPQVAAPGHPPPARAAAARSRARPPSWPAGRATPRASTSRAGRSRWSTGSRSA